MYQNKETVYGKQRPMTLIIYNIYVHVILSI